MLLHLYIVLSLLIYDYFFPTRAKGLGLHYHMLVLNKPLFINHHTFNIIISYISIYLYFKYIFLNTKKKKNNNKGNKQNR